MDSSGAGSWVLRFARLRVVIVDAHNDVLLEMLIGGGEEPSLELVLRHGEDRLFERYWLPRLERKDLYGVDVREPGLFHLTLDSTAIPREDCVEIAADAARRRATATDRG